MLGNQTSFTIYSVVGPTASGKTEKALALAEELLRDRRWKIEDGRDVVGVNLISVDSRQAYQGLEITTGADVPSDFELSTSAEFPYPFFRHQTKPINLHGISIIDVFNQWSVNHFINLAKAIIDWSIKHNWAVILVGGAGLYHRQLRWFLEGKEMVDVPPNEKIRQKATKLSIKELQTWLREVDDQRFSLMNQSDRNNSRRLVRAIEIALYNSKVKSQRVKLEVKLKAQKAKLNSKRKTMTIGKQVQNSKLKMGNEKSKVQSDGGGFYFQPHWQTIRVFPDNLETLVAKIRKRVVKRLEQGALDEVRNLLKLNLDHDGQVMTALGVPEMRRFLEGKITREELVDLWSLHELQYAKRQMTWWRKH